MLSASVRIRWFAGFIAVGERKRLKATRFYVNGVVAHTKPATYSA